MVHITMSVKEVDRLTVITKLINKELTAAEAATQLGLSKRHVKRIKKLVKKQGALGLVHQGRGKASNHSFKQAIMNTIINLLLTMYVGFGPTLAAEKLLERDKIKISDESLRTIMIKNNLWKPKPRKRNKQHREWRPRKDNYGTMQQYDGSYHHWFGEKMPEFCLLLAVDDATGKITKAVFDHHEGIFPTFGFWKAYLMENGKPTSIYLDKFSTYKINHQAAEDNKELITQFGRACRDLGIKPANKFMEEKYISIFNEKFAVVPAKRANLHRPLTDADNKQLPNTFSVHSYRVVMNDFTVRFKNRYFQLDAQQPLTVCRKEKILIEEHLDGTTKLKLRGKELRYTVLPKRPEKVFKLNIPALTSSKPTYKPPANHPWRKQFFTNKINLQTTKG